MAKQIIKLNIVESLIDWIDIAIALRLENEGMVSKKDAESRGIESGFAGLDLETTGFHNAELIYIEAPLVRKTDFALAMVANLLKYSKTRVGYFSLKKSRETLINILSSIMVKDELGWSDFTYKEEMPLFFIDNLNSAHKLIMQKGIQILFVDCLEVAPLEIIFLKRLAIELVIPVVVLANTTNITDLYVCPDIIEQHADLIMFLHNSDVIITKNKNGYKGVVKDVCFKRKEMCSVEEMGVVGELVKKAIQMRQKTLVYAEDNFGYALEFYYVCRFVGIKPVIGQKIALKDSYVILLCKDMDAYKILCRYSAKLDREKGRIRKLFFTEEDLSHFICVSSAEESMDEKITSQIPYIFPEDYFYFDNRCKRMMDNLPNVSLPEGIKTAAEYFISLVNKGIKFRYGEPTHEITERVQYEVDIILGHHFEKYFLVLWEIAAMCRKRGIIYSTYDKSSSSIICYVLRITDVDPLEYNLYPEFFIDSNREIYPQINIYVSKNIIQHLRNVYGADCVAYNIYNINKEEWEREDKVSEYRLVRNLIITRNPVCNYLPVYESPRGLAGWDDGYADVPCFNIKKEDCWEKYSSFAYRIFHTMSFKDRKTMSYVKKNRAKIYRAYWFNDRVKKRLRDFSLNSFADLVIVEAIHYNCLSDLAEELIVDIISRQKKGYKPLFDGSDEILRETYGKILFKEQFIQIIQLIAGWGAEKAILFLQNAANRKYEELKKMMDEFIERAMKFGLSDEVAKDLCTALEDSAICLASKTCCLGEAKRIWQASYLKEHYPKVLNSKN